MSPEIDETIYYLKIRLLEAETLIEQMLAGADNIEALKIEIGRSYSAVGNLHKLLKLEEEK